MFQKILVLSSFLFIISCGRAEKPADKSLPGEKAVEPSQNWTPPSAGGIVAKFERPVKNSRLYNAWFRVSVLSTDSSSQGHYVIKAEYGANIHEIPLTFPEWNDGRILKPLLEPDTAAYTCRIGFDTGDGQFHPYYLVRSAGNDGDMSIKQVATYMLSR